MSFISHVEIDCSKVETLLNKLDVTKSAGPDHLSPRFLIPCAKSLAYPISLLFKKSCNFGTVPSIWKLAYITPVHKKGSKMDITNYRPISKLCIIAKVFEKIIYDQLYASLKNEFNHHQHGFLHGRSTISNLILLNDYITEALEEGIQVDAIYTDYSKAFDRIQHNTLLGKLYDIGIRGDLFRWFTSYIENRSQAVVLNNYISGWISLSSGVPQGSLLAPLLFAIYVNKVNQCFVSSNVLSFADDMKVYLAIKSQEDVSALKADLLRLENYCESNHLDLNPKKCSVISFSRKQNNISSSYSMKGQFLPQMTVVRDLGVYHDSKLIFQEHIEKIVAKASRVLGFIMRISKCFNKVKTLKILYCSYVRSQLEYASQIWNPQYNKYIDRIENIQKRFIKYLCFKTKTAYKSENYLKLCAKFHLLPLKTRRCIADCTFFIKILKGEIDCPELLQKISFNIPSKSIRYRPPISVPLCSTNYRENSYLVRASNSYNKICKDLSLDPYNVSVDVARRTMASNFFSNYL